MSNRRESTLGRAARKAAAVAAVTAVLIPATSVEPAVAVQSGRVAGVDTWFCVEHGSHAVYLGSGSCKQGDQQVDLGVDGPHGPLGPEDLQGLVGPAGPAGAQGPAGVTGAAGPQGAAGPMGAMGPQGLQGLTGATGAQGPAGADGAQGPAGLQGAAGATGATGLTGPAGATGADGAPGAQGPAGVQGATGPMGAMGPIGPQGLTGPTGATGADGAQGQAGAAGVQGPAGVQGAAGPMGAMGPQGLQGATGAMGPMGPIGPMGPMGMPGAPGTNGVNGSTWYTGAGAPSSATGAVGDLYLNTDNGDVYKKTASGWGSSISNLTGPAGSAGSGGTAWTSGTGTPTGGNNGDFYLNTSTGAIYKNTSGTWSAIYTPAASAGGATMLVDASVNTEQTPPLANGLNTAAQVSFGSESTDVGNTWNGSTFTAPSAGVYEIQVQLMSKDVSPTTTVSMALQVYFGSAVNGPKTKYGMYPSVSSSNFPSGLRGRSSMSVTVSMAAGETMSVGALVANSSNSSTIAAIPASNIQIFKVG